MANIDYYTFPLSPYAYLAGDRLEQVAAKHGATIIVGEEVFFEQDRLDYLSDYLES